MRRGAGVRREAPSRSVSGVFVFLCLRGAAGRRDRWDLVRAAYSAARAFLRAARAAFTSS